MSEERECCPICGKLAFRDEEFAGYEDWYICKNPNCFAFDVKWRGRE